MRLDRREAHFFALPRSYGACSLIHECMGMHSLMKAGRCHQHTSHKVLAKAALRMLNGFLTFYYGAINFSCYYGDSAPGGEAGGN